MWITNDYFLSASQLIGYPRNNDFNGEQQEGVGYFHVTQDKGERCSAARAYLSDAASKPNLHIIKVTLIQRVTFEGTRATGVELVQDGRASTDPRFLSAPEDLQVMLRAYRASQAVLQSSAFAPVRGQALVPEPALDDNAAIEHFIRSRADSIYHPVGTCRMGADPGSVVDTELRVRGVQGLRVVDASIMPTLIGGNTNAPTIMIAEKAADFM